MITYNFCSFSLSLSPVFDLHFQQCSLTHIHSLAPVHTYTNHNHSELTFFSLSPFHTRTVGHTHTCLLTRTHSGAPFSLSLSLTHTDQKRKTPTGLILFLGMKNQSVFIFFSLSIIQFHNLDHNVGNLDDVQTADKANFLVYF